MRTFITVLFFLIFISQSAYAGDQKCDSLTKVLEDLRKKANDFADKYNKKIGSLIQENDRLVDGSSNDTVDSRAVIELYEKDTAYFQRCIDTANAMIRAITDNQLLFTENCEKTLGVKKFDALKAENTKTSNYLEVQFIDFALDVIDLWSKKLKKAREDYVILLKSYQKQ